MSQEIVQAIQQQYGKVAGSGLSGRDSRVLKVAEAFGYSAEDLAAIPAEANLGLSCGNPLAIASLKPGEVVVDLGCGGGMDVLLAARQVGPAGKAIGIDMTPEMIALASKNAAGVTNVEFHLASIDQLPLPAESVDCLISNCVINLAPDKSAVFAEIARVLKPGGRVAISDIALKKVLPDELAGHLGALVGCIAGAIGFDDYRQGLQAAGLQSVEVIDSAADLNAYAQVENQTACCSPSMSIDDSPLRQVDCGSPTGENEPGVHQHLAELLKKYDVNDFAASVRVLAVKG